VTNAAFDSSGVRFADTYDLGAYQVHFDLDGAPVQASFAVQMTARDESDLRPRQHAEAGSDPVEAAAEGGLVTGRRELWWPLGAMALCLACAEWALFHVRGRQHRWTLSPSSWRR
jgi:hypothetical protein